MCVLTFPIYAAPILSHLVALTNVFYIAVYKTRAMEKVPALDGVREWHEHAARRKPWTKAMSTAALKWYDALLVEKLHELVEGLETRARKGEVGGLRKFEVRS